MTAHRLSSLAKALLAFGVGLTIGVYYHAELLVWWRTLWPDASLASPPAESQPQTSASPSAHTSTLSLAQLPEPLPLVYSDTLEEERIQEYLKEGAVVLPLGTAFGESGNVVVTAHSSGSSAFGPYRFAFSRISELEAGQQFRISTPTAVYTYRVYGKEIVWPHEVNKLPHDHRSTVTLVTCWPLFTNFKRLLVHAELVDTQYQL